MAVASRRSVFVGKATEKKLHNLGITTIGALAKTETSILKAHFGKQGEVIHQFSNGQDTSTVFTPLLANKGYGNSVTTPYDVVTWEHAGMVLLSLSETVCTRLRGDGVKASCISVSVTDDSFHHESHQGMMFSASNITAEVYRFASRLLERLWDGVTPIRQMGVHTSRVTTGAHMQYNLFDLDRYERMGTLDTTIDTIRKRYGDDSIMRACFLNTSTYHMHGGISKEKKTGITKPV